ncbi:MAG TPA: hypothetical protein VF060_34005, partial [Trebonia sp.]
MRAERDSGEYYDGQPQDDDSWSPDEYFSPEGIKGRWASDRDGDQADRGSRGGPAGGYDDRYGSDAGDSYGTGNGYDAGNGYGAGDGYGGDSYGDGPYGQDGYGPGGYADEDYGADDTPGETAAAQRGGRRRRADKGERGLRRLVSRRGEKEADIWPDDGVSDEDYWASVAADKPLPMAEADDATQVMSARPPASPGSRAGGMGTGLLGPAPRSAPPAGLDTDEEAPQRPTARPGSRESLGLPAAGTAQGSAPGGTGPRPQFGGASSAPGGRDSGPLGGAPTNTPGRGADIRPSAPTRPAAGIAQPLAPSSQPQPTVAQPGLGRANPAPSRPGMAQAGLGSAQTTAQPKFEPTSSRGAARQPGWQGGQSSQGSQGSQAEYGDGTEYMDRFGSGTRPGAAGSGYGA